MKAINHLKVALSLLLVFGLCLIPTAKPASAATTVCQWAVIDTPSARDNVVVRPSEINAIAIGSDGTTFYAVDIPNSKVYKSKTGGITWDDLSTYLTQSGATLPVWKVVVAADNPNFVAVVTSVANQPRKVFISTNGGTEWRDTNFTIASNISTIDISMNYGTYDIAVGTRTGAGTGAVYVLKVPNYGNWIPQGLNGDILAARFSPAYLSDSSLVAVSANVTGSYLNLGIRDVRANTTNWGIWGPVEITTAGSGTSAKSTQVIGADLELPSDFSGQAASMRRIYVSIDAPIANAGIYRFDDTVGYWVMTATASKRIASIAYYGTYGAGKLLAGEVLGDPNTATVMIWFNDAPVTCPVSCWYASQKPPTGAAGIDACTGSRYGNAQVAWAANGSVAFAGTASSAPLVAGPAWPNPYLTGEDLDESAFSYSLNNGRTWNQLSLIDTQINFLADVVATADSQTLYLASINTGNGCSGFDSVWISPSYAMLYPQGKTWQRVLCVRTASNDALLRISPPEANQMVFFAARLSDDMRQTQDNGQSWQNVLPGINVNDFAVTKIGGTMHIHALENAYVRHGESNGQIWTWGTKIGTGLASGHSITSTTNGTVLVGDAGQGMIAYSQDNGNQFNMLPAIPVPGNVHAVIDQRIRSHVVIYAASDGAGSEIYSWVIGAASNWIRMAPPGRSFYGLAQWGTLYGAWTSGGNTAVDRTLNPEALGPPLIEWDSLATGLAAGVVFTREPIALKHSGVVDLWAIDNRPYSATTGRLWGFYDCLTVPPQPLSPRPTTNILFQPPSPLSPARDDVIPLDSSTGKAADTEFKWAHQTQAKEYELWLARDTDFNQIVFQQTITPADLKAPAWTLVSRTSPLQAGLKYFWRVKVNRAASGETGDGKWSEVMYFTVSSGPTTGETQHPGPTLLAPANYATKVSNPPHFSWAPVPEATQYELTLAKDQAMKQIVASKIVTATTYNYGLKLEPGTTYFWQVRATKPFTSEPSAAFGFTLAEATGTQPPLLRPPMSWWVWVVIALVIATATTVPLIISGKKKRRTS